MNPVAQRELSERFRTLRSPIMLSLWVLTAGGITFLAYLFARARVDDQLAYYGFGGGGSVLASASMGRFMLHAILLALLTAVVLVVPGQAAVSVVGERERQTLPLLQVSQLSARSIVMGKLASSLAYILLLLVATTPLLVVPVLLGGVTLWQVLAGVAMIVVSAVMLGAVSLWVSARAKSVQGAVAGSYLWTVVLTGFTLVVLVAEILLAGPSVYQTRFDGPLPRDQGRELYASWLNPYIGMVDASSDPLQFSSELVDSPYDPFKRVLLKRQGYSFDVTGGSSFFPSEVFFERGFVGDAGFGFVEPGVTSGQNNAREPIRGSVWPKNLAFQVVIAGIALTLASRRIRVPAGRVRSDGSGGDSA